MSRYEFHKIIMGYILIGVWATLIALIALGKVEQATSYGLDMCIVGLTAISTQWAQYMFGRRHPDEPSPPSPTNPEPSR